MAVEIRRILSGDDAIDNAHHQLADIITALGTSCDKADYAAITEGDMTRLSDCITEIFSLESDVMKEMSYAKSSDHNEEHAILVASIENAVSVVKSRSVALIKDDVPMMLYAIAGHVETMDVPLADMVSKKIRKHSAPIRRSTDFINRNEKPAGPSGASKDTRRDSSSSAPTGKDAGSNEDGINLKTIIVNTYSSTLLSLTVNKGLRGDGAKNVAYVVVAKAVNKATGKNMSAEFVKQIILSQ